MRIYKKELDGLPLYSVVATDEFGSVNKGQLRKQGRVGRALLAVMALLSVIAVVLLAVPGSQEAVMSIIQPDQLFMQRHRNESLQRNDATGFWQARNLQQHPVDDKAHQEHRQQLDKQVSGWRAQTGGCAGGNDWRADSLGMMQQMSQQDGVQVQECRQMQVPGFEKPLPCCTASSGEAVTVWSCHATEDAPLRAHLVDSVQAVSGNQSHGAAFKEWMDRNLKELTGHVTVMGGQQSQKYGDVQLQPGVNYHLQAVPMEIAAGDQDPLSQLLSQLLGSQDGQSVGMNMHIPTTAQGDEQPLTWQGTTMQILPIGGQDGDMGDLFKSLFG